MGEKIQSYFEKSLSLSQEDATQLHGHYYKEYGLALKGLVYHHKIDPMDYNREVDDALPLEGILQPDAKVHALLKSIDRSKVRLWVFTNAYVTHAKRVLQLLDLTDVFEGITFCDYAEEALVCKPYAEMYTKAMKEAGIKDKSKCFFVDDSRGVHPFQSRLANIIKVNVDGALEFGWKDSVWFNEKAQKGSLANGIIKPPMEISSLLELRHVYPDFFR